MAKQKGLIQTAETIGSSLGHLQAKYDAWMKDKAGLAKELHEYVEKAKAMLAHLGHTAEAAPEEKADTAAATARKRTISAAHREAISRAAKARWAARKGKAVAPAKPVRNVAAEVAGRMSRMAK